MDIKDLTPEQKEELVMAVINDLDMKSKLGLFQLAMLQGGKMAAETNARMTKVSTEATFGDKRYEVDMVITIEEIK